MALASELELPTLLQRIVEEARELIGARFAALSVWEAGMSAHFVQSGLDPSVAAKIGDRPRGAGVLGVVMRGGRPVRIRDLSSDPRIAGFPPHHPMMRSFLGVPIRYRDRVFGDLYLTDKTDAEQFSEEDESLAVGLGALAAVAIQNAMLFAREHESVERLKELDRLRADFVSMVSHELRNPIDTIRGFGVILRDRLDTLTAEERREFTTAVVRQADHVIALVEDVLDAARIEGGDFSYVFERYEPGELLEECAAEAQAAFPDHDIRLEAPADLAKARGDRLRMHQVLANLLQNAGRYSPAGSAVIVAARTDHDTLEITVTDEGVGIAPHDVPRLFRRFARVRRGDVEHVSGTGLGLYISRRIVEAHDGSIDAESEVGQGSTFRVRVPVAGPG